MTFSSKFDILSCAVAGRIVMMQCWIQDFPKGVPAPELARQPIILQNCMK